MTVLDGAIVTLRPIELSDRDTLIAIRSTPEVRDRWGELDSAADEVDEDFKDTETVHLAVVYEGRVVGMIQYYEEEEPKYRQANIDIYLDPSVHGRGIGTDAVRTVARFLLKERGHHRLVIDPAADNTPAIKCYAKVGFRPVGVMRQYERGLDGTWHDGLLMDLLASEFQEG
ncbi:GNAT family N-acetyltransferase [Catelliglobosispora koreensis]|uniref:GNAT family N-acetyltransferase n=1 Tax=Catelliglobosispora koreensis TaxID=129052 RepID=UPI000378A630|nr:GNAT family protein [Catelliglobosispora koreensis]